MSTQAAARRWTYAEFAQLPDDGNRYEVIGGELFVTPASTPLHQKIVARITRLLDEFGDKHDLGESFPAIDVLFAEGNYVEPDVVFVRRDRLGSLTKRGAESAPELVVEVLSPSTTSRDRGLKRRLYADFGVPEYWIVDPEKGRIEVHRQTDDPARRTEIATATLVWQPIPGGPELALDVPELLRDFR
jgi:Uma2 family endonuclease